jgi:hypothetical protein
MRRLLVTLVLMTGCADDGKDPGSAGEADDMSRDDGSGPAEPADGLCPPARDHFLMERARDLGEMTGELAPLVVEDSWTDGVMWWKVRITEGAVATRPTFARITLGSPLASCNAKVFWGDQFGIYPMAPDTRKSIVVIKEDNIGDDDGQDAFITLDCRGTDSTCGTERTIKVVGGYHTDRPPIEDDDEVILDPVDDEDR